MKTFGERPGGWLGVTLFQLTYSHSNAGQGGGGPDSAAEQGLDAVRGHGVLAPAQVRAGGGDALVNTAGKVVSAIRHALDNVGEILLAISWVGAWERKGVKMLSDDEWAHCWKGYVNILMVPTCAALQDILDVTESKTFLGDIPLQAAVRVIMIDWSLCWIIPHINTVSGVTGVLIVITGHHRCQESITDDPQLMKASGHVGSVELTDVDSCILQCHISDEQHINLKWQMTELRAMITSN